MTVPLLPLSPPSCLDELGAPRFGAFAGSLTSVDLRSVRAPGAPGIVGRQFKRKKWLYTFIATPEVAAMWAVVDAGYASNAFTLVASVREQRVLYDATFLGLPRPFVHVGDFPARGLSVRFRLPQAGISSERAFAEAPYRHAVRAPGLSVQCSLDASTAPPALTVVAPVPNGGVVNVTQKASALALSGHLLVQGKQFSLDGGVGGMDYTQGYLARHTAWRWAFACGRLGDGTAVSFNLADGVNDSLDFTENAAWLGSRLVPLGRARFDYDRAHVEGPWHITTADGLLDVTFTPFGAHREERDLKLVKSHFVQPVGLYRGHLTVDGKKVALDGLVGVTEDQDITW